MLVYVMQESEAIKETSRHTKDMSIYPRTSRALPDNKKIFQTSMFLYP